MSNSILRHIFPLKADRQCPSISSAQNETPDENKKARSVQLEFLCRDQRDSNSFRNRIGLMISERKQNVQTHMDALILQAGFTSAREMESVMFIALKSDPSLDLAQPYYFSNTPIVHRMPTCPDHLTTPFLRFVYPTTCAELCHFLSGLGGLPESQLPTLIIINRLESFLNMQSGRAQMLQNLTKILELVRLIKTREILISFTSDFNFEPLMAKLHGFAEELWTFQGSRQKKQEQGNNEGKKSCRLSEATKESSNPPTSRVFLELACHSVRPICRLNFSAHIKEKMMTEEERSQVKRCSQYFPHSLAQDLWKKRELKERMSQKVFFSTLLCFLGIRSTWASMDRPQCAPTLLPPTNRKNALTNSRRKKMVNKSEQKL